MFPLLRAEHMQGGLLQQQNKAVLAWCRIDDSWLISITVGYVSAEIIKASYLLVYIGFVDK